MVSERLVHIQARGGVGIYGRALLYQIRGKGRVVIQHGTGNVLECRSPACPPLALDVNIGTRGEEHFYECAVPHGCGMDDRGCIEAEPGGIDRSDERLIGREEMLQGLYVACFYGSNESGSVFHCSLYRFLLNLFLLGYPVTLARVKEKRHWLL